MNVTLLGAAAVVLYLWGALTHFRRIAAGTEALALVQWIGVVALAAQIAVAWALVLEPAGTNLSVHRG